MNQKANTGVLGKRCEVKQPQECQEAGYGPQGDSQVGTTSFKQQITPALGLVFCRVKGICPLTQRQEGWGEEHKNTDIHMCATTTYRAHGMCQAPAQPCSSPMSFNIHHNPVRWALLSLASYR